MGREILTHWSLQAVPKSWLSFNIHVRPTHWSSEHFKTGWHHLYLNSEVFRAVAVKYVWRLLCAVKIQAKNSSALIRSIRFLLPYADSIKIAWRWLISALPCHVKMLHHEWQRRPCYRSGKCQESDENRFVTREILTLSPALFFIFCQRGDLRSGEDRYAGVENDSFDKCLAGRTLTALLCSSLFCMTS